MYLYSHTHTHITVSRSNYVWPCPSSRWLVLYLIKYYRSEQKYIQSLYLGMYYVYFIFFFKCIRYTVEFKINALLSHGRFRTGSKQITKIISFIIHRQVCSKFTTPGNWEVIKFQFVFNVRNLLLIYFT